MPEPATHTAVAVTVGASSASIAAGSFLGVEFVVLGVALLGGAIAHIWLERMPFGKMLASIFGSTVLGIAAGQLSAAPVLATAIHFAPWLVDSLAGAAAGGKALVAFWIAFTAQKTVPILFGWLDKKRES